MPFELVKESKFELVEEPKEPKLEGNIVNLDTFEAGDQFMVSTPEKRNEWAAQGPEGWWEYANKTWFSDIYYGGVAGVGSLKGLTDRLRKNEYENEDIKKRDMESLQNIMMRKEEMMIRGSTWGKNVYRVVANIPTFAMEFAATSGLASLTRYATAKVGARVTGEVAKKTLVRKGLEVLGREAVVGLARTTVLPHRTMLNYGQRRLHEGLNITDKGISLINESQEKPITTFFKAYGDTFVEYYSETMGGQLFKPIGRVATRGMLSRMPAATRAAFTKIANEIMKKIPKGRVFELMSRGGWDGLIEEYGEERFGALVRSIVPGLDERDIPFLDKLQEAVFPGWEQASIELGAFAIWGGMGASAQIINNHLLGQGKSQVEIDKLLNNMTEGEKDQLSLKLGETFEEEQFRAQVVIKAASGEELTSKETKELDSVYKEFIDKGLIEPIPIEPEKVPPKIEKVPEFISTEEAVAFGKKATPEQIAALRTKGTQLQKEVDRLKAIDTEEADLEGLKVATRKQFINEALKAVPTKTEIKAQQIIEANIEEAKQPKDIQKKIDLLYRGREKQLDQRRLAIEREMKLLEKQKRTKSIQNKLDNLSSELESIHFQIADLEQAGIAKLEKEGITLKGEELERLRKRAFRQGEITLRKDLMAKIKARQEERARRAKAIKKVIKQPKKPENIIDIAYQKKINAILEELGEKKQTRKRTLNVMTTDELVKLADTIADLKETGKKVFTTKKEQRKVASEILRAALIKQAGGTKSGMFAKGSIEERRAKRSPLLKVADIITLRPLRMIRRLFGDVGEKLIYDSIDNADMQRGVYSWLRKKKIEQAMEDNKVTFFNLGKPIEINGKSYQVNNILRMYLATKDKKSYDALLFGNNLTKEEVNQFIDAVKEQYPNYIKFADKVQKIVTERTDEYAQTVETYFNVEMERVDVYFPIRRIAKGGISQEELNLDLETEMIQEQILRKGEGFTYTSADKKNTYSRKTINEKYQSEISLDFMGDAIKIIEKQEHLIAYAPLQKAFNKIINDPALQDAVKYNHGQAAWKWLNDYLAVNVNPDLMMQGSNWIERFVNRTLKPVRLGLSKAYLGFNTVTAGKQFPSLTLALKYTTPQDLAISMERMLFKNNRDEIYKLDPSLRNRVVSRDFKDLLKTIESLPESDLKRALLVASKAIDKKAFAMIMQMDKFAVLAVYDAVYRHQLKTKSEVEAKNIAHKAVIETQPQGGIKDLPAIYRTNNEFLRMMLMFTNQLNQIWNMARADLPREVAKGQYARASVGMASIVVSSTLIYIMSHGRLPQDPDDFFDAIFGSLVASVPMLGNWSMAMIRGYEPSVSPAASIRNNLKYMINNIQNEEFMKASEKAAFILAVWLQLPYSQPRRTIKGIIDLVTGETDSFRRLLWSEFMLENN
jgi:hypothetical protein